MWNQLRLQLQVVSQLAPFNISLSILINEQTKSMWLYKISIDFASIVRFSIRLCVPDNLTCISIDRDVKLILIYDKLNLFTWCATNSEAKQIKKNSQSKYFRFVLYMMYVVGLSVTSASVTQESFDHSSSIVSQRLHQLPQSVQIRLEHRILWMFENV